MPLQTRRRADPGPEKPLVTPYWRDCWHLISVISRILPALQTLLKAPAGCCDASYRGRSGPTGPMIAAPTASVSATSCVTLSAVSGGRRR